MALSDYDNYEKQAIRENCVSKALFIKSSDGTTPDAEKVIENAQKLYDYIMNGKKTTD